MKPVHIFKQIVYSKTCEDWSGDLKYAIVLPDGTVEETTGLCLADTMALEKSYPFATHHDMVLWRYRGLEMNSDLYQIIS